MLSCPLTLVMAATPVSKALMLTRGDTELGSQKLPSPQPRSQTLWGRGGLALYSPEDPVALTTVALPRCEVVSGLEDEMVAPLAPVSVTLSGKRVFTAVTNLKVFR